MENLRINILKPSKKTIDRYLLVTIQTSDVTILDTAGNYQFPAMRKLAIEKAHGCIIVYSIDCIKSFEEAKRLHDIIVDIRGKNGIPMVVVGNKIDADVTEVTQCEINKIASWGSKIEHIKTSAKGDLNVKSVFDYLMHIIREKNNEGKINESIRSVNRSRFSTMRHSIRRRPGGRLLSLSPIFQKPRAASVAISRNLQERIVEQDSPPQDRSFSVY